MANTYAGSKFTIDTDTNVAGLMTLKGSAPALTDDVCITVDASGKPATLTIEGAATLNCKSLNIGFTNIDGGSGTCGFLVNEDNSIIVLANSGKVYGRKGSKWTANGTARSVGTSDGSADQTFAQLHADNWSCYVDGTLWTWRPALTGEMVVCGTTSGSATIQVASDPRLTGLGYGQTIEIRTRADGTLIGTRTITSMTATTIVVSGGAITTSANESVYLPIGASEQVYTISGGNVVFGDGTASAWNNNGGAVPANGVTVAQCGVTITSQSSTSSAWQFPLFALEWTYVDARWQGLASSGIHIQGSSGSSLDHVQFHHSPQQGFYATNGSNGLALTDVVVYACVGVGILLQNCSEPNVVRPVVYANSSNGVQLQSCKRFVVDSPRVWSVNGNGVYFIADTKDGIVKSTSISNVSGYGIYCIYDISGIDITNPTISFCSSGGFFGTYSAKNVRVLGLRSYSNSFSHRLDNSDGITYGRTASSGEAGTVLWRCHEWSSTASGAYGDGDSIRLTVQNAYHESDKVHIPGLAAYGAATTTVTLNGATVATEYRVSHDYGVTWTDWAAVSTAISDTPDLDGEYIQFRVAKTDADTTKVPDHGGVSIACTFETGWTFDDTKLRLPLPTAQVGPSIGSRGLRRAA